MKVVLFCGGLGTRMREHSDTIPKPLVEIGNRPIIWHLMKTYATAGHKDFILCLGYRGDAIRQYFLTYDRYISDDFVLEGGKPAPCQQSDDVPDWRITFVDTGLHANIGERLFAVRDHLGSDEYFFANYSDQLSDVPVNATLALLKKRSAVACATLVKPTQSFHSFESDEAGAVTRILPMADSSTWLNGGYFAFHNQIFDFIRPGEELVEAPFERLIAAGKLAARKHDGFWKAMDTFKDKISFDRMYASGDRPWESSQHDDD